MPEQPTKTETPIRVTLALTQDEWDTIKLSLMTRRDEFKRRKDAAKRTAKIEGKKNIPPEQMAHFCSEIIRCSDLTKKLFSIPEISP